MKKRILIIEDEKEIVRIMQLRFETAGFEVLKAYDGQEGLKVAKASIPDLILLDLVLPKTGGPKVLQELKKDPACKDIPVIIVTGLSKEESEKKFSLAKADAYFMKPFDFIELFAVINELLNIPGKNSGLS